MKREATIFKNVRRLLERTKTIALKKISGMESMRSFLSIFFLNVLESVSNIIKISSTYKKNDIPTGRSMKK